MAIEQNVRKMFLKPGVEGSLLKPEVFAGVKRIYGNASFALPKPQMDPINQQIVDRNHTPLEIGSIDERLEQAVRDIFKITSEIVFNPQA